MTTTVEVTSHNYPVLVRVLDKADNEDGFVVAEERVIKPEHGKQSFYATTTRGIAILDLEYEDERAQ